MTNQAEPPSDGRGFDAQTGPSATPAQQPPSWQPPPPPPPPSGWPTGSVPPPPPSPQPVFTGRRGGGSIWLGIAIGLGGSVLVYGLVLLLGSNANGFLSDAIAAATWLWPVLLGVGGLVMALIPKTARTGAGILISFGVAPLVAGGLCVALLTGFAL
jgi:hypothetical protein